MRPSGRANNQLREIVINRHYTKYAEGSVLIEFGNTKVICNASITPGVPRFLKDNKQGWLTAEYSMLPRATHDRTNREAAMGKQGGRTQEIQRLIGRSLRSIIDLTLLGDNTITIDCDVIQADGGTRTAAITGACIALVDALNYLQRQNLLHHDPLKTMIGAVSVGIYAGKPILDLEYSEDCRAQTDMNVIMNEKGEFIEIQGTAEGQPFTQEQLNEMLQMAKQGIFELIDMQKAALALG